MDDLIVDSFGDRRGPDAAERVPVFQRRRRREHIPHGVRWRDDIYAEGCGMTNVAYNCDCMEYMRTLPDKAFDFAVVDPPYGININHNIGRREGDKPSKYK